MDIFASTSFSAKLFRIGYGHIKAREVIRLNASSALIHSHFNAKTLENDLAIITLPQNQLINVEIGKPIIIASRAVAVKDIGNVSSFGFESDSGTTISENLMVARQVVIENNACAEAFNRPVHHNQFCGQDPKTLPTPPEEALPEDDPTPEISGETSGSNEGSDGDGDGGDGDGNDDDDGDDAHNTDDAWANGWGRRFGARVATQNQQTSVCRGDTGSALVRKSDKGYVAFGIVSRVPRGCNSELPALYTLLPAFTQWLEDATLGEVEIEKVQE